jgi:adenosylcobinamide kinase / adenosylcobinamide-phosphate guanylyltransferase
VIWLITGGERSGKTRHAMTLARQLSSHPLYVATARRWDEEFEQRIRRHSAGRDEYWTTVEIEKELEGIDPQADVAVVDCVTLWLTNFFVDNNQNVERSLLEARRQFDRLTERRQTIIVISNEIGSGVHASTKSARAFVEVHGWMNQYIAEHSQKVILMVCGIPVTVKDTTQG